jgi:virulence-associated protein VagC
MATARVVNSKKGQIVLLPKEFWIASKEVEISRHGDEIILRPKRKGLGRVVELMASLPADMFRGLKDPPPQSARACSYSSEFVGRDFGAQAEVLVLLVRGGDAIEGEDVFKGD